MLLMYIVIFFSKHRRSLFLIRLPGFRSGYSQIWMFCCFWKLLSLFLSIIFVMLVIYFFPFQVLVDMIRVPDWAFEAAGQEMRVMGQETAYHPGLYLTATQVSTFEKH